MLDEAFIESAATCSFLVAVALLSGCDRAPLESHPIPTDHRPVADVCMPQSPHACKTDRDCVFEYPFVTGACLQGECRFPGCTRDADCDAGAVCVCPEYTRGGVVRLCIAGNCRVDADCGPYGDCSPTPGRCGTTDGYYCHTGADECTVQDECGPDGGCFFFPQIGHWKCGGPSVCNG